MWTWPWSREKKVEEKYISKMEMYELIQPFCTSVNQLADRRWKLIPGHIFDSMVIGSGIRNKRYRPETYDCDNFAHSMLELFNGKGYAVGIIQGFAEPGQKHRWIFYVNMDKEVIHIEPQTYLRTQPVKGLVSDFVYTI